MILMRYYFVTLNQSISRYPPPEPEANTPTFAPTHRPSLASNGSTGKTVKSTPFRLCQNVSLSGVVAAAQNVIVDFLPESCVTAALVGPALALALIPEPEPLPPQAVKFRHKFSLTLCLISLKASTKTSDPAKRIWKRLLPEMQVTLTKSRPFRCRGTGKDGFHCAYKKLKLAVCILPLRFRKNRLRNRRRIRVRLLHKVKCRFAPAWKRQVDLCEGVRAEYPTLTLTLDRRRANAVVASRWRRFAP